MAINQEMAPEEVKSGDDASARLQRVGRYQTILENIQDAYYEVDLGGHHNFFNDALCRILRFSREELQGMSYKHYMEPETAAGVYEVFNKVYRTGEPVSNFDYQITRGDGEPAFIELSVSLMRDEEGEPIGFQGIIRDKTEQKLAEQKLKQAHDELEQRVAERTAELSAANSHLQEQIAERNKFEEALEKRNQLLEKLSDLSRKASLATDFDSLLQASVKIAGEALGATSAYLSNWDRELGTTTVIAEYYGPEASEKEKVSDLGVVYSLEEEFGTSTGWIDELEGKPYISYIDDPDMPPSEKAHFEKFGNVTELGIPLQHQGQAFGMVEIWESRKKRTFTDEEIEFAKLVANQIATIFNNNRLYQQATKELQERRQAEQALQESQEIFRVLTESAQSVIYLCYNEPDFPMIYLNDAVESLTGYPKEEFLEKRLAFSDLFHPEDRILPEEEEFLAEEGSYKETYRIKHRSGKWRWIEDFGSGVLDQEGNLLYLAGFMNDVTDRKALEDQVRSSLERRSREVKLSAQVAREIAAAADLKDLYNRVVTQVKEQFDFYHVQLLRYDALLDSVMLIAGYGRVGQKMLAEGHHMPMGVGLIGSAAATGKSYLQPDIAQDPNWQPNPLLPDTKGELAVPIKLGNEVLGVLDIQSDEVNALTENDQLAIEGLCGQIAIAIESTSLRQDMSDRLRELNRLQRLMSREGWKSFQVHHEADNKGYYFDRASIQPLSFDRYDGENGRFELSDNVFKTSDLREIVTAPLTVRGEMIGTLAIQNEEDQPLTTEDKDLIDSISVQVAEALESARLLEQTQKNAADMETVAQVGAAASTILETEDLLQTVVDLTQERFDLYFVSVFAMDNQQGVLNWVSGTQLPVTPETTFAAPAIELDSEKSLIAAAGRSRKPVIVNDVAEDPRFLAVEVLPDTRSEMVIPLIVGDELLGIMDLQSNVPNRFGDDDVRIHTTLAAQVAIAWKNALLYAEQLETTKRLREVDRLKSEFMASMSHELRTPLNSIIGFSDVLLEGMDGPLTDRMVEDVTLIRDSGRHLRELISEILDMSKIEAGMMELRYDVVDVAKVAKEIVGNARSLTYSKNIDIELDLDPKLDKIEADRTRLIQVLLNLMSNAIKFTNEGNVCLEIRDEGENIHFAVQDTGIGIDAEDIPVIFEQFRQIDGSLTRKAGGTGLGMPISKSLVELHGGEMEVHSEPGVGSTFSFSLPKQRPTKKKRSTGPLPEIEQV